MGVLSWSTVPAENAAVDPFIPARQNAAARDYIDAIQGVMAGVAALSVDQSGVPTSGSGNAYVATSASGLAELAQGVTLVVVADRANTAASTLQIDDTGVKPWRTDGGANLTAGEIVAGRRYPVSYHAASDTWRSAFPGRPADAAPFTLRGNATGSLAQQQDLSAVQVRTLLSLNYASTLQAQVGTDTATVMTPALVRAAVAYVLQQPGILKAMLPTVEPATSGTPWLNGDFLAIKP